MCLCTLPMALDRQCHKEVFITMASYDTRMHVQQTTVDKLLDYVAIPLKTAYVGLLR